MKRSQLVVGFIFLVLMGFILSSNLGHYFTLSSLKENQLAIGMLYISYPLLFVGAFSLIYILVAGMGLPFATVLTLAGGVIFGSYLGTLITIIAATLGASVAFLFSRYMFRESLESKYAKQLEKLNKGVNENALNYVLSLRLLPLFPFFIVNTLLGLTRVNIKTFMLASFIGMLPGTFIYTNAGSQLSTIKSLGDIASPHVIGAFVALGALSLAPILIKKLKGKKA